MREFRPIITDYQGIRFRSRLEARWAVLLTAMGAKWVYEPEGYFIDGYKYLPDFRLESGLFIEVKGELDDKTVRKLNAFAATGHNVLVVSDIPINFCNPKAGGGEEWKDLFYSDWYIGRTKTPLIPVLDSGRRMVLMEPDMALLYSDVIATRACYVKALGARFEFDGGPKIVPLPTMYSLQEAPDHA